MPMMGHAHEREPLDRRALLWLGAIAAATTVLWLLIGLPVILEQARPWQQRAVMLGLGFLDFAFVVFVCSRFSRED